MSSITLIGLAISAPICIYIYMTYFREGGAKVPKQFTTTLRLFTRRHKVHELKVVNSNGIMFPDNGPAYVEIQSAAIVTRSGRVWKSFKSQEAIEAARKRNVIYIVRENDPQPLNISLGSEKGYLGDPITHDAFDDLSTLNQREASATATAEGSTQDQLQNKLMIALIIATAGAVGSWALVFALSVIYGQPVTL